MPQDSWSADEQLGLEVQPEEKHSWVAKRAGRGGGGILGGGGGVSKTYRPVCLLAAGEAEGGATLAEDIQGLISPQVRRAFNSMLTVGRWAPSEALVVLNIAAQLILLQLLLVLV